MFSIIKKGTEEEFLKHLNKVRPSIKFTMELESNNTFPTPYACRCLSSVDEDLRGVQS